ncbi:MAG: Fe-S cluster assembly protein SufD [Rhizobiales bacterium 24-66-13]|jgi:Fe-S cluster assembly protein SufD|nr:MAG: Fe-S cluster assembly protein SufD [Rhizobiales bacterium 24-66-13]HQS49335.1 Fe-S cluster assembly protein SufD [Xanthobacteraceae bacterium]
MNAGIAAIKTEAETGLADTYTAARHDLPGGPAVAAARAEAFNIFALGGLPHRRLEAWKYTDLRRLMKDAKPLAGAPDTAALAVAEQAGQWLCDLGARRIVVVNGTFAPALSDLADLEEGLTIRALAQALVADEPLLSADLGTLLPYNEPALALNTAFAGDGVVIEVAAGAEVKRPIHLLFVTAGETAAAIFTRSVAVIGAGASVSLIESHEGPEGSDYQVNAALQVQLGDEARLDHVKIVREGGAALHVGTLLADIGARARFNAFGFIVGGSVVRNQMFVRLAGADTVAEISGVSLLAGRQHADTTLSIEHAAPGSQSRETFKAVVDEAAHAVFQGKIAVRQQAQKTDARMMSRALLLSAEAEVFSKPELEIFADDVQCGHGATTGTLDDQLKFYLMARGIPAKEAEALLIQAFVGEVIDTIAQESLRDALSAATLAWLGERG